MGQIYQNKCDNETKFYVCQIYCLISFQFSASYIEVYILHLGKRENFDILIFFISKCLKHYVRPLILLEKRNENEMVSFQLKSFPIITLSSGAPFLLAMNFL